MFLKIGGGLNINKRCWTVVDADLLVSIRQFHIFTIKQLQAIRILPLKWLDDRG